MGCFYNRVTRAGAGKPIAVHKPRQPLGCRLRRLRVSRRVLRRLYWSQGCRLDIFPETLRFESPYLPIIREVSRSETSKLKNPLGFLATEQGGFEPPVPFRGTTP